MLSLDIGGALRAKLAVVGCGNLGETIVAGLIGSKAAGPGDIVVTNTSPSRLAELQDKYGVEGQSNTGAVRAAEVVLLAVKPKDLLGLLEEITKIPTVGKTFISVAAGVSTSTIENALGQRTGAVRAMPNLGAAVGKAMTALSAGTYAGERQRAAAEGVFRPLGKVLWTEESHFDAITALSGSGPAYFALLAEAMIDAGAGLGLSRDDAEQLVVQTMQGTASMLTEKGLSPGHLRSKVASPGGTTEAALNELFRLGFSEAVQAAVKAAAGRARELGT